MNELISICGYWIIYILVVHYNPARKYEPEIFTVRCLNYLLFLVSFEGVPTCNQSDGIIINGCMHIEFIYNVFTIGEGKQIYILHRST